MKIKIPNFVKFAAMGVAGLAFAASVQGALVGLWEFDNAGAIGQATLGEDLSISGTIGAAASGIGPGDGAASIPQGSYFGANHAIGPNGGSAAYTNEYSLVFDIYYPAASAGSWMTFYQTNDTNGNDGDLFIRNGGPQGAVGVGDLGYSTDTTLEETWYRVVLTHDLGTSSKVYVDGTEWIDGGVQGLDGRFALWADDRNPKFLLFADNDGDDAEIWSSNVGLFDHALGAAEVAGLGSAGSPIPEPSGVVLGMLSGVALLLRRRR